MTHLREIILSLADADVDFVIAGGVACVLHGIERFTLDLDVSVHLAPDNLERFIGVMERAGLVPRVPVPPASLIDPAFRRMIVDEKNALVFTFIDLDDPRKHVDMLLTDDLSFDVLHRNCEVVDVEGRAVKITSPAKLLELKEGIDPPRDKDLVDIKFLKRLLGHE